MSDIRALRKSLKSSERQARFTAKMKENGMKRVSVWVTADNADEAFKVSTAINNALTKKK